METTTKTRPSVLLGNTKSNTTTNHHHVVDELKTEEKVEEQEGEESACAVSSSVSGMEMIALQQPVMYTSLKDILPASPSPTVSPTYQNSSWNEIPIKNQLVKQAALAYLQPMATPPDVGDKGLFGRLKLGECCKACQCGCLQWINDVVFKSFREVFLQRRQEIDAVVDNDYHDNDNDHDRS